MRLILIVLLICIIVMLSGCISVDKPHYVELEGKKIIVELAQTPEERKQGLMHREELCPSCGMLFLFEQENIHPFWMKNTIIPLDIVFINANYEVVDVTKAEPCIDDPCKNYFPQSRALYVLETNQGMFSTETIGKKANIVI